MLAKNSLYLLSFYNDHENLSININRDITMMKLAQRLSFLNSSGVHRHTSGFAHRVIFVLSLLIFCLGSVWGQEYVRYELKDIGYAGGQKGDEHYTISITELDAFDNQDLDVEFTFRANEDLSGGSNFGTLTNLSFSGSPQICPNEWVGKGQTYTRTYTIKELKDVAGNDNRVCINVWGEKLAENALGKATFVKAEVLVPKPDDPFLNTANENCKQASGSEKKQQYTDVSGELSFAKIKEAFSGMEDVKYARIYVKKDGNIVEYNTKVGGKDLLEVTGGKKAGESENNGLYVYNNGEYLDLDNINVTLNGGTGNLDRYEIVVLLSKDAAITIDSEGNVTKEPQWGYEYTYSFTYPTTTKVRYKTLIIANEVSPTVSPILISNWFELAGDCGVDRDGLAANLYVRWYLEDKDGNEININNFTQSNNAQKGRVYTQAGANKGYYRKGFDNTTRTERDWQGNWVTRWNEFSNSGNANHYIVTFTLWNNNNRNGQNGITYNYNDVRLVCVATTKGGTFDENKGTDPDGIQVKYIYTLKKSSDLKFAHYEGEAYRYLQEIGSTEEAKDYGYIRKKDDNRTDIGGTAAPTWNSETNDYYKAGDGQAKTEAVRQNVHTVHYYYYVKENEQTPLSLPLQYYNKDNGGGAEPRAYFRWYDYETDENTVCLVKNGTLLNSWSNYDSKRGLFAFNIGDDHNGGSNGNHPVNKFIGVKFNASEADFKNKEEILIACDVSRY